MAAGPTRPKSCDGFLVGLFEVCIKHRHANCLWRGPSVAFAVLRSTEDAKNAFPGIISGCCGPHVQIDGDHPMSNDIASKVSAIIVEKLGVDEADITPEASFTNDLGADSLDTVELIMEFEKEFDLTIPDEEAENIATVGDAIKYLSENTN